MNYQTAPLFEWWEAEMQLLTLQARIDTASAAVSALREREAAALRQSWQLRKECERAQKIIHKGAGQRLGPLGRMKLADRVNHILGGPVMRPVIELTPVRKDN